MIDAHRILKQQEAYRLYAQGITQKEIALKVGVTEKTVGVWRRAYHWDTGVASDIGKAYKTLSEGIQQHTQHAPLKVRGRLEEALETIHITLINNHLIAKP